MWVKVKTLEEFKNTRGIVVDKNCIEYEEVGWCDDIENLQPILGKKIKIREKFICKETGEVGYIYRTKDFNHSIAEWMCSEWDIGEMQMSFKYPTSSIVLWEGQKCIVWGIHIHKDGNYEYHLKLVNNPKRGIFKVREKDISSPDMKVQYI